MARPLRITFPGAFYHVTSRGNERKTVFTDRRDREKFLEYLASATERYTAVIHAYCLMGNHYHLLLETPSGNLPQIMRHINGAYTTYFNIKRARSGHLFQGRYKAILVEMDQYAKTLSRYMHLNPVRAMLVSKPEEYEWSSYKDYIGARKPIEWLQRDFILGYFDREATVAQKEYEKFVYALLGQEYESPLSQVTASVLLGSHDFIEFVKKEFLNDLIPSRDLPAARHLVSKVPIDDVFEIVESVFEGDPALARSVKMYLCQKYTGEKLKKIGSRFRISDAAVSQACKRFRLRLASDTKLKEKTREIDDKLKKLKVET